MARDRDELERDLPLNDEDIKGIGEDEFDQDDEESGEDLDEEEEFDDDRLTGEVGSEGGSFGESVRKRGPRGPASGSEAGETIE